MHIHGRGEVRDHGEGTEAVDGYKITTFSVVHLQLIAEDGGATVVDDRRRRRKADLDDVRGRHRGVRNRSVGGLARD